MSALVLAPILVGAGVLLVSLVRVRSVFGAVERTEHRRHWRVMAALMAFFFLGYLVAAAVVAAGHLQLFRLLVGGIFLAGAVFVLVVVHTGVETIETLSDSRERIRSREEELERLYQVTDVLNRVLRHNLRNTINVIIGRSELVRQTTDDEAEQHLNAIERVGEDLIDTGKRTREIKRALDSDNDREIHDVTAVVNECVDAVSDRFPDATIRFTADEEHWVRGDPLLATAVEHVLDNAIRHNDGETPEVTVSVETTDDEVAIEVADDGPGIPANERAAIRRERETPLEHGLGLGLWITQWILDSYGGDVRIEDNEPRGTVVTLAVPKADAPTSSDVPSDPRPAVASDET